MSISSPPFETVRYGLVGFGRFCRNRLMPAFAQISGSQVIAICRRIIDACRSNKVQLMVAHTLRFSAAVRKLKEWIDEGRLGKVAHASALFTYDGTKSPRIWLQDNRLAGGGALMDIGVHFWRFRAIRPQRSA